MNRRTFLKAVAGAVAAVFAPKVKASGWPPVDGPIIDMAFIHEFCRVARERYWMNELAGPFPGQWMETEPGSYYLNWDEYITVGDPAFA